MRPAALFLLISADAVLQASVFDFLRVFGVRPDFTSLLIVSYAILRGDAEGALFGLGAGFFRDILFGQTIGHYMLLCFLTGYIAGKPFKHFFPENDFLPLILSGIFILLFQCADYFLSVFFIGETDFLYFFSRYILPCAIYSVVLALPAYRLVYWINKRLVEYEKGNRDLFK